MPNPFRALALLVALVTASFLAACGGRGGSVPAKPVPNASPAATSQQRNQARQALAQARQDAFLARYVRPGQKTPFGFRRAMLDHGQRRVLSARGILDTVVSPCQDGVIETVTTNPDGSSTVLDKGFWDETCVKPALMYLANSTLSAPDANGVVNVSQTQTNYAEDGATVTGYDVTTMIVYNANIGAGNFVVRVAHYANASVVSGPALDTDYYAVLENGATAQVGAASLARDPDMAPQTVAELSNSTVTTSTPDAAGHVTVTSKASNQTYIDPTGTMSIAFPFAAGVTQWVLTGGTLSGSSTETDVAVLDAAGALLSENDMIVDAANDITMKVVTVDGGKTFTGTLTQTSTGAVIATFTLDANGSGSITYADQTNGTISNWCFG